MIDSVSQSLRMALKSIGGNKLRAFLTMLGIIIGVMALVILVSLVNGATGTVTDTISSLGSNLLTVTISDDKGYPVTLSDLPTGQSATASARPRHGRRRAPPPNTAQRQRPCSSTARRAPITTYRASVCCWAGI